MRNDECQREEEKCLWHPCAFGDFRKKNTETHVALCRNFSCSVNAMDLVEALKDVASLLVCTRKNFFWLGVRIFCE